MKRNRLFIKRCTLVILLLTTLFFVKQSIGQTVVITNPVSPWTVPAGVTSIKVEVWGGGGGGGGSQNSFFTNRYGGGGGGGGYSVSNLTVTSGQVYSITVGAGGTVGLNANGGNGGASSVTGPGGTVTAAGGLGGARSTGAAGGTGGIGNANDGGRGGTGNGNGGGGGGGAGNAGNGIEGSNTSAGSGGPGSPNIAPFRGGNGGASQNTATNNGNSGIAPGGGGGGGKSNSSTSSGGIGGAGQVVITYVCPTATISYNPSAFCKSVSTASVTINGSTGGSFSVIPSTGLVINSSTGAINPSTSTVGSYTVHYKFAAANGCPAVDATAPVKINPLPVATVPNQTNINCHGGADGTITVSAGAGSSPYAFSIDNGVNYFPATGADSHQFTGLQANTPYTIKVKDANGCISN